MLVVVITKTTRRSGRVSSREEVINVERLSIGRGTDNDIQLNGLGVELHHSRLRKQPDGIYIKNVEATELEINGRRTQERRLDNGDVIRIGLFELRVLPSVGDEDLRVEIETITRRSSEREELARRTRIGLDGALFSERKLSWFLFLAIPAVFLVTPLMVGTFETTWDTGPLARKHANIANDCAKCHTGGFARVRDQECLVCHQDISAHTPQDLQLAKLDETRCARCHLDHNGDMALAAKEQELCSECHRALEDYVSTTEVRAVTDFGDDHPEFRVSIPEDRLEQNPALAGKYGEWTRRVRRVERTKGLEEHSGVKFSHVRHVGQEEIKGRNGEVLDCGYCHQPDTAGKNFVPLNFETNCQACHPISFDERDERQAIHGDPVEMRKDIREFYTAIELRKIEQERLNDVRRGRVGKIEEEELKAAAMARADEMVRRADEFLMDGEKAACANCHFVAEEKARDGGYDVSPVRLLPIWMPKANFMHRTHEPYPCADCHQAAAVYDSRIVEEVQDEERTAPRTRPQWSYKGLYKLLTPEELKEQHGEEPSDEAVDLLIPGRDKCTTCHAGEKASAPMVPSDCVLCHPFHRREFDRMRPLEALPRELRDQPPLEALGVG
jgi:pSer/pThr/pTyr-binding forkhead associated (FHA) protein